MRENLSIQRRKSELLYFKEISVETVMGKEFNNYCGQDLPYYHLAIVIS